MVVDFGPRSLKAIQQHLVASGISRGVINARINRIRRMFKWAASEELIPVSIYDALRTVAGLRAGRMVAREPEPIGPVADETIDATLPFVAPPVAAMIQLQRTTGMRPGEVVTMRASDIDASGDVWM
jgi:integrase